MCSSDLIVQHQLRRATAGSLAPGVAWTPVVPVVEDVLGALRKVYRERNLALEIVPTAGDAAAARRELTSPLDRGDLLELVGNLLDNAIRHSHRGGTVWVVVSEVSQRIRVSIADEGPGIALQDRERMFERFWSGADRGGQSGLGLAISRAIARRHGGELQLGENRPGRCELLVLLPSR